MADHDGGRRIVEEGVWAVGGDQCNSSVTEKAPAGLLRDEITGEPVGRLDNDRADAVARDVLQHGGEARPLVDRVRAFHGVVAVFGYQLISGSPGKCLNGGALALERVLVLADVGC